MIRTTRTMFALLAAVLFAVGVTLGQEATITVLHVNDTHAHLDGFGPKGHALQGELGGIARAATVIGTVRATEENVLLLHAGDIFHGDFIYNQKLGIPELMIMSALGFDAMTVGNHEFELGPDPLVQTLTVAAPTFPLLSANLDMSGYPPLQPFVKPAIIKSFNGVKVGIFGLTVFDDVTNMPYPVVISPDFPSIAAAQVAALKADGAKAIICLSHLGINYDRVLAASVPGINFIVGGHDHLLFSAPEQVVNPEGKTTFIVQAGEFYKEVGKLKFTVKATGEVVLRNWRTLPVDEHVPAVPEIKAIVDGLKADVVAQYGRVYDKVQAVAVADLEKLYDPKSNIRDTPLGNLVTDAYRRKTGTQIALAATGLISEKIYAGPVVDADIFRAVSYGFDQSGSGLGFRLVTLKITGADLIAALEMTLAQVGVNEDFFIHVSGMRFRYDPTQQVGSRVVLTSVRIGSQGINPGATYTATVNEGIAYLLGMLGVTTSDLVPQPDFEYTVVHDFIKRLGVVWYRGEGRIIDASVRRRDGDGCRDEDVAAMTAASDEASATTVTSYALRDNYPNPFNPSTTIGYELPAVSQVTMKVYNMIGQEVATLVDGPVGAGVQMAKWNASGVASGVYLCRITATGMNGSGSFTATRKLMLVK